MGDFSHLSDHHQAAMVNIAQKTASARDARVQGRVRVSPVCAAKLRPAMIQEIGQTARLAGIHAAKQTSSLIPLCHQVPLSGLDIRVTFESRSGVFDIEAVAHTYAATGVEMEAMCAVGMAAITIYDMVKGVDPAAVIESLALVEKRGGKNGDWVREGEEPRLHDGPRDSALKGGDVRAYKAAIIVCSDRAHQGTYPDQSGPVASEWLTAHGYPVVKSTVLPDDAEMLENAVFDLVRQGTSLIVISGGTGLGPRDMTPETLERVCDYGIPGFGELLRQESLKYSLNAYLSRGGGWVKGRSLILALPGHPKAVVEQLGIVADLLPHALKSLEGSCDHRRSGVGAS